MTDYQPQVFTPPAQPGQVRKVGHLEIPAHRAERHGNDAPPPLDVELVDLRRTEDGRLLCYRQGWPAPGTGCAGCRFSGHEVGCPSAFKDAYSRTAPKPGPKPRIRLRRSQMTPEQLARVKAWDKSRRRARYRDRCIADCTPEEAEKLRARWRAQQAKKRRRNNPPASQADTGKIVDSTRED